jgi:glycine oxidase
MDPNRGRAAPVHVVGGGVIGLSIAWRAARAGLVVTVHDPDPGGSMGASHAAAGVLAPVSEAHLHQPALVALNLASHRRWPAFAAELAAAGDVEVPLRLDGSVVVAQGADDERVLDGLRRFHEELGLAGARLTGDGCRGLEPALSPRIVGGLRVDGEGNVDNRAVCRALLVAAARAGVTFVAAPADPAALLAEEPSARVVVTAGAWSGLLDGLPAEVVPPVRPVKGQIIRLRADPADLPVRRNIRVLAPGGSLYVAPRASGEIVVGATVEERGFDTSVTAGGLGGLLGAAIDAVPALAELEQVEAIARLRPATPDGGPVLGPTVLDRLILATGHHRNGVLLAPVTADAITALLIDGNLPSEAEPFTIDRFA